MSTDSAAGWSKQNVKSLTDLFIRRPILSLVVNTLILLLGLAAVRSVPIREFPLMENATITITTNYPGGSAW